MYSLAARKIWPEFKKVVVQFLFLKFPRSPAQELEYNEDQLKGFEYFLESVNRAVNDFGEKEASANYAADNQYHWLCGPAKSGWICPFHKPFDYYVLLNEEGEVIKSSHKNDFNMKEGQSVDKRHYDGCPRQMCGVKEKDEEELDDFDF